MAITTYAELQSAVATWLVRGDLTARIPEFIALGEARLNRIVRSRQAEVERSATLSAGERVIGLPAGFTEPLAVWLVLDAEREALRFVDPALMQVSDTPGRPSQWGIAGAGLAFNRPCDQAYTVIMRLTEAFRLSDDAPTNALLIDAPDVYLFAALCEAAPLLRDAELASAFEARLRRAVTELNSKDARSKARATLSTEPAALLGDGRGYRIGTDS